jgi:hypothetical protein
MEGEMKGERVQAIMSRNENEFSERRKVGRMD